MSMPRSTPHVGSPYNKPGYNSRNIECKHIGTQNEHCSTRVSLEEIKKVFLFKKPCKLFRLYMQCVGILRRVTAQQMWKKREERSSVQILIRQSTKQ